MQLESEFTSSRYILTRAQSRTAIGFLAAEIRRKQINIQKDTFKSDLVLPLDNYVIINCQLLFILIINLYDVTLNLTFHSEIFAVLLQR